MTKLHSDNDADCLGWPFHKVAPRQFRVNVIKEKSSIPFIYLTDKIFTSPKLANAKSTEKQNCGRGKIVDKATFMLWSH